MYLSHYKLVEKPFQITADPRFLWLGEKHQEALATLKYGVLDDRGFLLLTGDVGTGKTTLINALLRDLDKDIVVATVVDPNLEKLEFFNLLADAFDLNKRFHTKVDFLIHFSEFLRLAHSDNKKVLL
ncbi:MAG: ATPase, T2SS/T4P/T4SS family, partial [Thermodesulfobacteriota bacterium]|nr:ATPase, T2SS/T4P/T4SS family [Thermodesulfobacteriota bacterium]